MNWRKKQMYIHLLQIYTWQLHYFAFHLFYFYILFPFLLILLIFLTFFPVVNKHNNSLVNVQPRETQLEPRIAKFISLICNISMMKQQMLEIGQWSILLCCMGQIIRLQIWILIAAVFHWLRKDIYRAENNYKQFTGSCPNFCFFVVFIMFLLVFSTYTVINSFTVFSVILMGILSFCWLACLFPGYNAEKLPLGKLSKSTILKARFWFMHVIPLFWKYGYLIWDLLMWEVVGISFIDDQAHHFNVLTFDFWEINHSSSCIEYGGVEDYIGCPAIPKNHSY